MGRKLFLKAGDRVKMHIDEIGELEHTMVA
jgi:2-keto-4-pentenoate hydratase/2-oxohepta-3-ene-1,7-dioic acid hydratase in catechol pathway